MKSIYSVIFICALLVIFVLGAIFDFEIANALFYPQSVFSSVISVIAEQALYISIAVSLIVFYVKEKDNRKIYFVIFKTFFLFLSTCFSFLAFFAIYQNFYFGVLSLFLALAFVFIGVKLIKKLREETLEILYKFCSKLVVYIIVIFILNRLVKFLWGRVRFIDIVESGYQKPFMPIWQLDCFSFNMSFYSGHVTAVCSLLPLAKLFDSLQIKKGLKIGLNLGCYILILLTMLSRMLLGAHYLTDVVFALIVAFIFCYFMFYKQKKNKQNS